MWLPILSASTEREKEKEKKEEGKVKSKGKTKGIIKYFTVASLCGRTAFGSTALPALCVPDAGPFGAFFLLETCTCVRHGRRFARRFSETWTLSGLLYIVPPLMQGEIDLGETL